LFSLYPQHFAMVVLGFSYGLRPSALRPLRRKGPNADTDWEKGTIRVRRSNSRGQQVMKKTKTGKKLLVVLSQQVLAVLRWHVDRLPEGRMLDSDLLFPARHGGFRARSVLDKPFKDVASKIGLKKRITPRGMRRTNKDLLRAADIEPVVAMAVSGHTTDEMHVLYSTPSAGEKANGPTQPSASHRLSHRPAATAGARRWCPPGLRSPEPT
jgi:hypothetical protein